jgi:hypothetical protein
MSIGRLLAIVSAPCFIPDRTSCAPPAPAVHAHSGGTPQIHLHPHTGIIANLVETCVYVFATCRCIDPGGSERTVTDCWGVCRLRRNGRSLETYALRTWSFGVGRGSDRLLGADEKRDEDHGFMPGMPVAVSISARTSSIAVGSIAETPSKGLPSWNCSSSRSATSTARLAIINAWIRPLSTAKR